MGRAGLNRKTALATATLTLGAEAADLDVLSRFGGSAFGLNHHRGFTHSFLGIPLVAAVVVGFVYLLWRLRGRKTRNPNLPPRWGLLFTYACLASATFSSTTPTTTECALSGHSPNAGFPGTSCSSSNLSCSSFSHWA